MILYCATTNPGKVREFNLATAHFGVTEVTIELLAGMKSMEAPEETGATFEENAILKAVYYSRFVEGAVFADDSGLVVDALGGAPGVHSARYAGEGAGDAANNALVLERMRGVAERAARFVCVIALAREGKLLATFAGAVEGVLLDHMRGTNGFGYDPMFYFPEYGCTLAEVEASRKMDVSHRGKALKQLLDFAAARG